MMAPKRRRSSATVLPMMLIWTSTVLLLLTSGTEAEVATQDEATAGLLTLHKSIASRYEPSCSAHLDCVDGAGEPLSGRCCPNKEGDFHSCCPDPTCSRYPACVDTDGDPLRGTCCPTLDGTMLDCCFVNINAECKHHPACSSKLGDCCPDSLGEFDDCCFGPVEVPAPSISGGPQCSNHPACIGGDGSPLAGDCCPTIGGDYLSCCFESSECKHFPGCAHLEGTCCPNTKDREYLNCCFLQGSGTSDDPVASGADADPVPVAKPTKAPVPSPSKKPVAAPTKWPVKAWRKPPTKAPIPAPTADPTSPPTREYDATDHTYIDVKKCIYYPRCLKEGVHPVNGDCCPDSDGWIHSCCYDQNGNPPPKPEPEPAPEPAPVPAPVASPPTGGTVGNGGTNNPNSGGNKFCLGLKKKCQLNTDCCGESVCVPTNKEGVSKCDLCRKKKQSCRDDTDCCSGWQCADKGICKRRKKTKRKKNTDA